MEAINILCLMVLCHILDDFLLQQKLAEMKQSKFWLQYNTKYHNDYIVCLMLHATEWTIMVSLPIILLYPITWQYALTMLAMIVVHAYVDDLKCNKLKINLIRDQSIHILQIAFMFAMFVMFVQ